MSDNVPKKRSQGQGGIKALTNALHKRPQNHAEICVSGYVELRAPFRAHLCRLLQRYLIDHSHAPEPVMEAFLALEVGL